ELARRGVWAARDPLVGFHQLRCQAADLAWGQGREGEAHGVALSNHLGQAEPDQAGEGLRQRGVASPARPEAELAGKDGGGDGEALRGQLEPGAEATGGDDRRRTEKPEIEQLDVVAARVVPGPLDRGDPAGDPPALGTSG